ncbi:MAG: ABC transporter permease [Actinomycetota bacterium]|nr:ABC transporter permease [Actinomycetota bacterium]MDQ3680723.1 ABC transporter permease [Actinomycetota bacterium]
MRSLREPLVLAGVALLGLLLTVAVLAPLLSPYDPQAVAGDSLERPSAHHLLGTNNVGQDIFSQILFGARSSLSVAVGAAVLTVVVGVAIGVTGGLVGGWADTVTMRLADVFLALPRLPLLVVIAALAGPSRVNLVFAIGLMIWPVVARVVRGQTRSLRQRGFVGAARGFGGGLVHVVRRHLVPALSPVIVTAFVNVAAVAVLLEAGLAFLGLADPNAVSWGLMMNRALLQPGLYFTPMWTWWVVPTGLAISLAVLAFTFLGVGLEPVINPRLRRGR